MKEAMNKPPNNEFEDWLNEHGPEMEGEDDCESLMYAAWKAAQLTPSCMNCAEIELLTRRVQELEKALKSAASTAHYRGVLRGASDFCHGSFDECTNCACWKTILAGAQKEAAK